MAIVMALLSGLAGVYTEAIIKKRPSRNTNVQNFFLYDFGMLFSTVAIVTQDFDAMILMILNQALRCILLQWQCFSKHLSPTFYLVSIKHSPSPLAQWNAAVSGDQIED